MEPKLESLTRKTSADAWAQDDDRKTATGRAVKAVVQVRPEMTESAAAKASRLVRQK